MLIAPMKLSKAGLEMGGERSIGHVQMRCLDPEYQEASNIGDKKA